MFTKVIPKVFYRDLAVGRDLFVDGLQMQVSHDSPDFVVVQRDGCTIYLVQAGVDCPEAPELAIETGSIDDIYADITARRPDLLHPTYPRGGGIVRREYGAREFAVLDATTVCVVFRDWT
ncbi:MAG: hypothetical protein KBB39_09090 [Phycicoccus sp.]|nr:hypothetical protein [Phycicoccus sp.]